MHSYGKWQKTELGAGTVQQRDDEIHLHIPAASAQVYHDAQISDYSSRLPRFSNRPPLRLSVSARFPGKLCGTAGFGFWNHCFEPGLRRVRPPQAIWFFYGSEHNNIALANGVAGSGWKAAIINARRWQFYAMLPLALPGFLLMRNKRFYEALWPIGQRAIGVQEAAMPASLLEQFHNYTIEWHEDRAVFRVNDDIVLDAEGVTSDALGFIAWIDNQYAIVTPQGRFGWGLLDVAQSQSLILRDLKIERSW